MSRVADALEQTVSEALCKVGMFLCSLDAEERIELDDAIWKSGTSEVWAYGHLAIEGAIKKLGGDVSEKTIRNHRAKRCGCSR